jgi:hypothetical protein
MHSPTRELAGEFQNFAIHSKPSELEEVHPVRDYPGCLKGDKRLCLGRIIDGPKMNLKAATPSPGNESWGIEPNGTKVAGDLNGIKVLGDRRKTKSKQKVA